MIWLRLSGQECKVLEQMVCVVKKNNCRRWLFSLHDFDGNYCKCCNYCNNGNGSTAVQKVGAFKLSTEFNIWMFGLNFLAQYSLNLFPTNFIKERKNNLFPPNFMKGRKNTEKEGDMRGWHVRSNESSLRFRFYLK